MSDIERFRAVIDDIRERRKDGRAVTLKGKKYTTVQDRIEAFRSQFGAEYGIETFVDCGDYGLGEPVMARCIIKNEAKRIVATGHAVEFWGSSNVNSTSALENAETSAIGRALATLGIHGGEFASANEMEGVERKGDAENADSESVPVETPPPRRKASAALKREEAWPKFEKGLNECQTADAVSKYITDFQQGPGLEWPQSWRDSARDAAEGLYKTLRATERPPASSAAEYARQTRGE